MDVSLNPVIEVREKSLDEIEEEATADLNAGTEEEGRSMPENGARSTSGYHYQIRNPDNGQVTYRVVQVGGDENNQQATLSIVATNGILNQLSQDENNEGGSSQVAIVENPFNNGSTNETSTGTGTSSNNPRFAYFQSSSGSTDLPSPTSAGSATSGPTDQQLLSGGQFYVMMSPQEMIPSGGTPSGRTLLSRTSFQPRVDDSSKNVRDDTRRVQHNEVERRRRDKINTWIMKLATLIPECAGDHTKQGQSKGGILAKACDFISDLQNANAQLSEKLAEYEAMQHNYEMCRQQLEDAKQKIQLMTQTLLAHQIEIPTPQAQ